MNDLYSFLNDFTIFKCSSNELYPDATLCKISISSYLKINKNSTFTKFSEGSTVAVYEISLNISDFFYILRSCTNRNYDHKILV